MTAGQAPLHVSIAGLPGSLALPVTGLYEVFNAFPMVRLLYEEIPEAPFEAEIVAAQRANTDAASGLPMHVHRAIDEIEHTDIVIVPSMAGHDGYAWETGCHPAFVEWLAHMHRQGAMLCSACSGALVLAETGLLDGRQATTHWAFADTFRENFPAVELCLDEVLVATGDRDEFVMSGGSASWHDLALHLIARHVGPATALAMRKFMLLEWHAEGQAPFLPFRARTDHGDAAILQLQDWIESHFSAAAPVDEMAHMSGLTLRSLERRFRRATGHSPIDYVQRLRVEAAKRRLERSDAPIDEISWEVGYENAAFFRRLFKRLTCLSPSEYRRKFRMPQFV